LARVKTGTTRRHRHRAVLKAVRGHRGARSNRYRVARESLIHALAYSTAHRKLRKRDMRRLWILRINAAVRKHGLNYGKLMHGLKQADIKLNRKQLADLSVQEPDAFEVVAKTARVALEA